MDPQPHAISMNRKLKLPGHMGVAFGILHMTIIVGAAIDKRA